MAKKQDVEISARVGLARGARSRNAARAKRLAPGALGHGADGVERGPACDQSQEARLDTDQDDRCGKATEPFALARVRILDRLPLGQQADFQFKAQVHS